MRPLAVLILILGAVAALIFALVSILNDGPDRGTAGTLDLVVRPAEEPEEPSAQPLAEPNPVAPAEELTADRMVIAEAGSKGAYEGFIDGQVIDMTGLPIVGAEVSLLRVAGGPSPISDALRIMNDQPPPRAQRRDKTDDQGHFSFTALEPAVDWTLVVTHEEFTRAEAGPIEIAETGGHEEKIVLERGLGFFGRVLDAETGGPVEGVLLVLDSPLAAVLPDARRSASREESTTDAQGNFGFKNLGGSQRTLVITAEGYATQIHNNFFVLVSEAQNQQYEGVVWNKNRQQQRKELAGQPKKPIQKDFELARGHLIAGRVLGPDRQGVEGVAVTAMQQAGVVSSRGDCLSGPGGEFLVEDVAEGLYTVRAEAQGFHSLPVQRVEAGRTDVEIVLAEQGGVSGRVVDATTGKPVSNFTCRVRTIHPRHVTWGGVVRKASFKDRSNGSFTVSGINEGEYVVEAFSRGYASSFGEPVQVTQGITTRNVVVRLTKGGTIKGKVVDQYTGEPIAGAEVKTNDNNYVDSELMILLDQMSSSASSKRKVRTDEEGEFTMELMTPDEYQVQIKKAGYTGVTHNNVKVGDGVVTDMGVQPLSKGAVIKGLVYGPDGDLAPGARVLLNPTDNNVWGSMTSRTDANGRFVLKNAEPGTYKLSASRVVGAHGNPFQPIVDMRHSELEITVADGRVYEYELYMAANN